MEYFDYLRSFIIRDSGFIKEMESLNSGRDDIQPSVEPELGKFLGLIIRLTNAKKVLEIGSGVGYSTIWLGEGIKITGGKVTTIDNHQRTHKEVIENISRAGLDNWVEKKLGNAEDVIDTLTGDWDIIFQDSGKYLYPLLHDKIVNLTRIGGLIIADDTMFKVNPEIRKGLGDHMDKYNKMVFSDPRLYSAILSVGHGITVSLKKVSTNGRS
ncbi:MAG: class I SAM-dependent methyltransferase [Spirochaetota bacterium]|nr:class I SAM-dependent methyltransferase [Spirochaetota bacterium]